MAIPFWEVVLHTIMNHYQLKLDRRVFVPKDITAALEKRQKMTEKFATIILPICFTIFLIGFATFGVLALYIWDA